MSSRSRNMPRVFVLGLVFCAVLALCAGAVSARELTRTDDRGHVLDLYAMPGNFETEVQAIKPTDNPTCYMLYGRCLPYFFIVGTFKSGTTSLYKYLSFHPNVQISVPDTSVDNQTRVDGKTNQIVRVKEIGFFNRPISNKEYQNQPTLLANVEKAEAQGRKPIGRPGAMSSIFQYLDNFPEIFPEDNIITGEGTPNYLPSVNSPKILSHAVGYGRFINIMREPIYRGYSRMSHLWTMMCMKGRSTVICHQDLLPKMFDTAIDLVFDGYKNCAEQHWSLDVAEIDGWSDEALISKYTSLATCSRNVIQRGSQQIKGGGGQGGRGQQQRRMGPGGGRQRYPGQQQQQQQQQRYPGQQQQQQRYPGQQQQQQRYPGQQQQQQRYPGQQQQQQRYPGQQQQQQRYPGQQQQQRYPGQQQQFGGAPQQQRYPGQQQQPMNGFARNLLGFADSPEPLTQQKIDAIASNSQFKQFIAQAIARCMLHHSLYTAQIHHYARYLSEDQFLNILAEELFDNPAKTMALVEKHLSLDPKNDWNEVANNKYNVGFSTGKEAAAGFVKEQAENTVHIITDATQKKLEAFFAPYNRQVGRFIDHPELRGEGLSPWKDSYDVVD